VSKKWKKFNEIAEITSLISIGTGRYIFVSRLEVNKKKIKDFVRLVGLRYTLIYVVK
jgi:hypothetical protein